MVEKVIEIVGTSRDSFIDAVDDAVATAQAVQSVRWVRVKEVDRVSGGGRPAEYRAVVHVYFNI